MIEAHQRPVLPLEDLVGSPDWAYCWDCLTCKVSYRVMAEAMHSRRLPRMALRIWAHYHMHRTGPHEIVGRRAAPEFSEVVDVDERDLLEALAWWEGFILGQCEAAKALREPLEKKLRELEGR